MWLSKCKNELLNWLFPGEKSIAEKEVQDELSNTETLYELEEKQKGSEEFKLDNVVFDKLNYLEQYIKIFSLTFPKEYQGYLAIIQDFRSDYEKELEEYKKGLAGSITFAIDPEKESYRYVQAVDLENEIEAFVENEVNYKLNKDKFSKLCSKLNVFYNAIIDTDVELKTISNQLTNACDSLRKIVEEVKDQEFFEQNSRKKEEILNYIVYGEYIVFKSFLRCSMISNFNDYKQELSEYHSFFINEEYDRLMFKFLIEDLEQLQVFITDNLKNESTYQYVLENCQKLQNQLDEYTEVFNNNDYFAKLIKFENTISNLTNTANIKFSIDVPSMLDFQKTGKEIISVKSMALAILSLVDNDVASLLYKVVERFNVEISWREFFFLCKIFELNAELIQTADNTIFSVIKDKFLKIEEKYQEYTDDYIKQEKINILNYRGNKSKKYILLMQSSEEELNVISDILTGLSLDFVVNGNEIYLNHSYFNGFKNLEENFGAYKIF